MKKKKIVAIDKTKSKKSIKQRNISYPKNVSMEGSRNANLSSMYYEASEASKNGRYASSAVPQPRFQTNYPTGTNFTITLNNEEGSISEGSLEEE